MAKLLRVPQIPLDEPLLMGFTREQLVTFVEVAIALLDAADGDIDLEEDDPSGDSLDEHGEHPTDDASEILATLPIYGINQSAGPINEREALLARNRSLLRQEFR